MPLDAVFNPSGYRLIGSNLVYAAIASKRFRRAAALLADADQALLEDLARLARVNVSRATTTFNAVAILYVSIPITLAALVSEMAPQETRAFMLAHSDDIVRWVALLALTPAVYFCGLWRARQILWAVELIQARAIAPVPQSA